MTLLPGIGKSQDFISDSIALMNLYNNCNGVNWVGFDNWMETPVVNWEGVTVSDVNRVLGNLTGMESANLTKSSPVSGTLTIMRKDPSGSPPRITFNYSHIH